MNQLKWFIIILFFCGMLLLVGTKPNKCFAGLCYSGKCYSGSMCGGSGCFCLKKGMDLSGICVSIED